MIIVWIGLGVLGTAVVGAFVTAILEYRANTKGDLKTLDSLEKRLLRLPLDRKDK